MYGVAIKVAMYNGTMKICHLESNKNENLR